MPRSKFLIILLAAALAIPACRDDDDDDVTEPDAGLEDVDDDSGDVDENDDDGPFAAFDADESWALPELSGPVFVVRTEANIPHIYAENDVDAALVHGFVAARDRFFMMDLTRRLTLGTTTELLGIDGLSTDLESRMYGSHHVAQKMLDAASPEVRAVMEAYARGINHYIAQVAAENLPYPSEVDLAWQLLGFDHPTDMLEEFEAFDVAAMLATFIYQTSFGSSPVGRMANVAQLDSLFEGDRFQDLRRQGAIDDVWGSPHPVYELASGQWGPVDGMPSTSLVGNPALPDGPALVPEMGLMERLSNSIDSYRDRRGWRDDVTGMGSNAWVVSGDHSADGSSLMAADGHLALGIPSILWNVGIDTALLSGDDGPGSRQLGMVIPGIPYVALGTNGHVAWGFTQLFGDVTDWYAEEIQLDDDGLPAATFFDGEWRDLQAFDETYEIAEVPFLNSDEDTLVKTRWETFDGRWLIDVEGTPVSGPDDEAIGEGQSAIRTFSGWVVPEDVDGSGAITAISMTYAGHQMTDVMGAFKNMGASADVADFRESLRGMLASSFNYVASDSAGDIFYMAFQGTPCRSYLPREADGRFAEGADPTMLLDGTQYGAFEIPQVDGVVDDSHIDDPYRCIVPFDESPQDYNPDKGYLVTANNDPAGIGFDSNLFSGPWYIGGPFYPGFRAETIERNLQRYIADGQADIAAMAELQGNVESPLARVFLKHLFDAVDHAEGLQESTLPVVPEDWEQRMLDDYDEHRDRILEAIERLEDWAEHGHQARSGVETFYHQPNDRDRADAVATSIFNAYLRAMVSLTLDDENFPGIWQRGGTVGRVRLLYEMLESRGGENRMGLSSFNEDTGESVFFDDRSTDDTEHSDELMVRALIEGLAHLESEPVDAGRGGYGTDDMDQWLWGLRHQVEFQSLLADFLGNDPSFSVFIEDFSITTSRLPLAENMESDDPRRGLQWFPRDGDQYAVDASNPGIRGDNLNYSSGPVMRTVIALNDGEVEGVNIIPGGQSALTNSEFFHDQAALWLGNDTHPMRFHFDDVLDGMIGLEVYEP